MKSLKEFTEIYGELAFVALSMKDYENLALNIADIKRYVEQQKEIILYYEKAVTEQPEEKLMIDMIIDLAIHIVAIYRSWYTNCNRIYC